MVVRNYKLLYLGRDHSSDFTIESRISEFEQASAFEACTKLLVRESERSRNTYEACPWTKDESYSVPVTISVNIITDPVCDHLSKLRKILVGGDAHASENPSPL